ncbi:MAG: protein-L-isoaspartate O-methyltransferase [Legionellales bacterium]|nr:protein-L-isoaspartate O-methyltransferase [Legionellales bacterium]|tara:strand:- start:1243 stop:1890 length:648 start_codon:yes stop_codon:yes gene_type:complete
MTETPPQSCLQQLFKHFEATANQTGMTEPPSSVLEAFCKVNRAQFVPETQRTYAWEDRPLIIGCEQTISQPFMVVLMTALSQIQSHTHILEIGTGSGYQTALLSHLAAHVTTFEVIPELSKQAQRRLSKYSNITFHMTHEDHTPQSNQHYDAILVTCCAPAYPGALVSQLNIHGRLVIPIQRGPTQHLYVIQKRPRYIEHTQIMPVRFVPMQTMS